MFGKKRKPNVNRGFHVSPQLGIKELEAYLNSLPYTVKIISIAHQGGAGQNVYVVYKI